MPRSQRPLMQKFHILQVEFEKDREYPRRMEEDEIVGYVTAYLNKKKGFNFQLSNQTHKSGSARFHDGYSKLGTWT
ncbi:hypothetical protein RIF29_34414 [Crotalaria pallida]|uniref:Uncharacterized protein n=1 Tax=Crotalaria pallida TaxID=3830 RepID=A0AAN9EA41_CROPI